MSQDFWVPSYLTFTEHTDDGHCMCKDCRLKRERERQRNFDEKEQARNYRSAGVRKPWDEDPDLYQPTE